jgi:hypothetical protein
MEPILILPLQLIHQPLLMVMAKIIMEGIHQRMKDIVMILELGSTFLEKFV